MLVSLILAALYDLAIRTRDTAQMLGQQAAWRAAPATRDTLRRTSPRQAVPALAVALLVVGTVGAFAATTSTTPSPASASTATAARLVVHAGQVQAAMLVTPPPDPIRNQGQDHTRIASTYQRHVAAHTRARHIAHIRAVHRARLAAEAAAAASAAARAAATATPAPQVQPAAQPTATAAPPPPSSGGGYGTVLSYSQIEQVWVQAGGPADQEATAANVAECESGGQVHAYNPSGASGIFQILGQVVPGDIFDPLVNAENAVAKFNAAGGWSPWVCAG